MKKYQKILLNSLLIVLSLMLLSVTACKNDSRNKEDTENKKDTENKQDTEVKPYDPYAFDALTEEELKADTKTLMLRVVNSKYLMQWYLLSSQSQPEPNGKELKEYKGYQELLKREDFLEVLKEYEQELSTQNDNETEGRKRNLWWFMAQNEVKELLKQSE